MYIINYIPFIFLCKAEGLKYFVPRYSYERHKLYQGG